MVVTDFRETSQLSKTGKLIYPTLRCFATLQHDSKYPGWS
jgi:hypothetical protein